MRDNLMTGKGSMSLIMQVKEHSSTKMRRINRNLQIMGLSIVIKLSLALHLMTSQMSPLPANGFHHSSFMKPELNHSTANRLIKSHNYHDDNDRISVSSPTKDVRNLHLVPDLRAIRLSWDYEFSTKLQEPIAFTIRFCELTSWNDEIKCRNRELPVSHHSKGSMKYKGQENGGPSRDTISSSFTQPHQPSHSLSLSSSSSTANVPPPKPPGSGTVISSDQQTYENVTLHHNNQEGIVYLTRVVDNGRSISKRKQLNGGAQMRENESLTTRKPTQLAEENVVNELEELELSDGHQGAVSRVASYATTIYNLRAQTNYTFAVKAAAFADGARPLKAGARSLNLSTSHGGRGSPSNEIVSNSLSVETKPFSAEATRCLADTSEVLVSTGRFFSGRISVENSLDPRCQLTGNGSSEESSYLFKIDHQICGSRLMDGSRIETIVLVHENKDILTHNTARFLVLCNFIQKSFTLKASVSLPKVNNLMHFNANNNNNKNSDHQQALESDQHFRPATITQLPGKPQPNHSHQMTTTVDNTNNRPSATTPALNNANFLQSNAINDQHQTRYTMMKPGDQPVRLGSMPGFYRPLSRSSPSSASSSGSQTLTKPHAESRSLFLETNPIPTPGSVTPPATLKTHNHLYSNHLLLEAESRELNKILNSKSKLDESNNYQPDNDNNNDIKNNNYRLANSWNQMVALNLAPSQQQPNIISHNNTTDSWSSSSSNILRRSPELVSLPRGGRARSLALSPLVPMSAPANSPTPRSRVSSSDFAGDAGNNNNNSNLGSASATSTAPFVAPPRAFMGSVEPSSGGQIELAAGQLGNNRELEQLQNFEFRSPEPVQVQSGVLFISADNNNNNDNNPDNGIREARQLLPNGVSLIRAASSINRSRQRQLMTQQQHHAQKQKEFHENLASSLSSDVAAAAAPVDKTLMNEMSPSPLSRMIFPNVKNNELSGMIHDLLQLAGSTTSPTIATSAAPSLAGSTTISEQTANGSTVVLTNNHRISETYASLAAPRQATTPLLKMPTTLAAATPTSHHLAGFEELPPNYTIKYSAAQVDDYSFANHHPPEPAMASTNSPTTPLMSLSTATSAGRMWSPVLAQPGAGEPRQVAPGGHSTGRMGKALVNEQSITSDMMTSSPDVIQDQANNNISSLNTNNITNQLLKFSLKTLGNVARRTVELLARGAQEHSRLHGTASSFSNQPATNGDTQSSTMSNGNNTTYSDNDLDEDPEGSDSEDNEDNEQIASNSKHDHHEPSSDPAKNNNINLFSSPHYQDLSSRHIGSTVTTNTSSKHRHVFPTIALQVANPSEAQHHQRAINSSSSSSLSSLASTGSNDNSNVGDDETRTRKESNLNQGRMHVSSEEEPVNIDNDGTYHHQADKYHQDNFSKAQDSANDNNISLSSSPAATATVAAAAPAAAVFLLNNDNGNSITNNNNKDNSYNNINFNKESTRIGYINQDHNHNPNHNGIIKKHSNYDDHNPMIMSDNHNQLAARHQQQPISTNANLQSNNPIDNNDTFKKLTLNDIKDEDQISKNSNHPTATTAGGDLPDIDGITGKLSSSEKTNNPTTTTTVNYPRSSSLSSSSFQDKINDTNTNVSQLSVVKSVSDSFDDNKRSTTNTPTTSTTASASGRLPSSSGTNISNINVNPRVITRSGGSRALRHPIGGDPATSEESINLVNRHSIKLNDKKNMKATANDNGHDNHDDNKDRPLEKNLANHSAHHITSTEYRDHHPSKRSSLYWPLFLVLLIACAGSALVFLSWFIAIRQGRYFNEHYQHSGQINANNGNQPISANSIEATYHMSADGSMMIHTNSDNKQQAPTNNHNKSTSNEGMDHNLQLQLAAPEKNLNVNDNDLLREQNVVASKLLLLKENGNGNNNSNIYQRYEESYHKFDTDNSRFIGSYEDPGTTNTKQTTNKQREQQANNNNRPRPRSHCSSHSDTSTCITSTSSRNSFSQTSLSNGSTALIGLGENDCRHNELLFSDHVLVHLGSHRGESYA